MRGRAQWQWTLDAPRKLRRLIVPRGGRYDVALEAEHHRRFSRVIDAKDEKADVAGDAAGAGRRLECGSASCRFLRRSASCGGGAGGWRRIDSGSWLLPRLPSGVYELWAVTRLDEEMLIASNGALPPPVQVELSGGEASVPVTAPPR